MNIYKQLPLNNLRGVQWKCNQGLCNVCRNITGDLSLRCAARAVAHLGVHLPCVGAAPPRSRRGAPEPREGKDREQEHQQRLPMER